MIRLGVNIDHIATLRQARYQGPGAGGLVPEPDPVAIAAVVERAGAHGITVHLREDRRHIQDRDVRLLRRRVRAALNLEMADVPAIVAIAVRLHPDEVCLVPERRLEVTTEGGLDVAGAGPSLRRTIGRLQRAGARVSLFIDPDANQVRAAAAAGADFIELHTGTYADAPAGRRRQSERRRLVRAAQLGHELGLRINAGHGLNYRNVVPILRLPHLETLNIGHAIVSRAVFVGMAAAVREMLAVLRLARPLARQRRRQS